MICKEEISSWFKDSTGAKRIEVLCSLLRMCLPMELRFIGTCLEDLARKDFIFLREAEIRANDADNMERLTADFFDEATRGKISVYLSLLYSTNNRGSEAMFKMLCCLLPSLRSHTNGWCNTGPAGAELIDSTYAEDVILLLTMSANHPAFTFNQRQHLYSDLQSVEELLQVFSWKDDDLTVTFSCLLDNNEYDETMTGQMNEKRSEGGVGGPQGGVPQGAAVDDTAVPPCGTPAGTATCPGSGVPPAHCYASTGHVYVKQVERLTCRPPQHANNVDHSHLHLQVTWSNGNVTHVMKTCQQVQTLLVELRKLFVFECSDVNEENGWCKPEESLSTAAQLDRMASELSSLSGDILRCHLVSHFFSPAPAPLPPGVAPLGVAPHAMTAATRSANDVDGSCLRDGATVPIQSFTIYNTTAKQPEFGGGGRPPLLPAPHGHMITCGPVRFPSTAMCPTFLTAAPYPGVATLAHPSSPASSPPPLPPPCPPEPAVGTTTDWIRCMRLHKYRDRLSKYTSQQLVNLTDHDLEQEGLTASARRRFHAQMQRIRKYLPPPVNGGVLLPPGGAGGSHVPAARGLTSDPRGGGVTPTVASYASSVESSATSTCSESSPPSPALSPDRDDVVRLPPKGHTWPRSSHSAPSHPPRRTSLSACAPPSTAPPYHLHQSGVTFTPVLYAPSPCHPAPPYVPVVRPDGGKTDADRPLLYAAPRPVIMSVIGPPPLTTTAMLRPPESPLPSGIPTPLYTSPVYPPPHVAMTTSSDACAACNCAHCGQYTFAPYQWSAPRPATVLCPAGMPVSFMPPGGQGARPYAIHHQYGPSDVVYTRPPLLPPAGGRPPVTYMRAPPVIKPVCCNCGALGHRSATCLHPNMDGIARSGFYHLDYTAAKVDSE